MKKFIIKADELGALEIVSNVGEQGIRSARYGPFSSPNGDGVELFKALKRMPFGSYIVLTFVETNVVKK